MLSSSPEHPPAASPGESTGPIDPGEHSDTNLPGVDRFAEFARDPSAAVDEELAPADLFCALACLRYDENDEPPRIAAARELLGAQPELVSEHIWAAAAAGNAAAIRDHLTRPVEASVERSGGESAAGDPNAVGGPFGWPPLLYLAYSRVPGDAVAASKVLLDAGADPNAGYLWRGLIPPFTALTGAFGGGEQGEMRQPPHPDGLALARLLLDAGADPNDGQTLYNRMFTPDDAHLGLLYECGLGSLASETADGSREGFRSPWRELLGDALDTPDEMLQRVLAWAGDHGFADRVALLGQHGMDLDQPLRGGGSARERLAAYVAMPADVDQRVDGATALHEAAFAGDLNRIRALLAAGADTTIRDDRFDATALQWAEHAYQEDAARLLRAWSPGST